MPLLRRTRAAIRVVGHGRFCLRRKRAGTKASAATHSLRNLFNRANLGKFALFLCSRGSSSAFTLRGLKWRQPSQSARIPVLLSNPRPTWLIASSLHLFLPNRRQSRQSTFHSHTSCANRRQPPSTLMSERCFTNHRHLHPPCACFIHEQK